VSKNTLPLPSGGQIGFVRKSAASCGEIASAPNFAAGCGEIARNRKRAAVCCTTTRFASLVHSLVPSHRVIAEGQRPGRPPLVHATDARQWLEPQRLAHDDPIPGPSQAGYGSDELRAAAASAAIRPRAADAERPLYLRFLDARRTPSTSASWRRIYSTIWSDSWNCSRGHYRSPRGR
jgi:hypothetical protein